MRFITRQITSSGRIGKIVDLHQRPGIELETPLLLMHTRGGNIPHVTHEVLQMISHDSMVMQMPITTLMAHLESIKEFDKGVAPFVGLQEYPVYITPQDPAVLTPSGYNIRDSVAVWCRNGKTNVNPEKYMMAIEIMKPDMYLALCDGDTNLKSSAKRVSKSVSRSVQMFKDCLQHHNSSQVLKSTAILAAIEGGYDLMARKTSIKEMAVQPVSGFVIDGLHNNGPEVEGITFDSIDKIVCECISSLPPEKLRVIHGAWNPVTLLHLVAAGFDAFDASLAYLSTERNAALCFAFEERFLSEETAHESLKVTDLVEEKRSYEIYVEDDRYMDDFSPLLKGCQCLACRKHTKAYVHHLLKTKELLGKVLLMIHNVHHYLEFFKSIRNAILSNSLENMISIVSESCRK